MKNCCFFSLSAHEEKTFVQIKNLHVFFLPADSLCQNLSEKFELNDGLDRPRTTQIFLNSHTQVV